MTQATLNRIVDLMSGNPQQRKETDLRDAWNWFKTRSNVIMSMNQDLAMDLLRNCSYQRVPKDHVIMVQGEKGDLFYILANGCVSVYRRDEDPKEEDPGKVLREKVKQEDELVRTTEEKRFDRKMLGGFIVGLGPGKDFGDGALRDNITRTASIIADEITDLLVIHRDLYNKCVREILDAEYRKKDDFINANPFLRKWTPKYRRQLAMAMYKESYNYDSYITRQGCPVDSIYYIISGEVFVTMDTRMQDQQYPRLVQFQKREGKDFTEDGIVKRPFSCSKYRASSTAHAGGETNRKSICILGHREAIGEMEMLLSMETYAMSTKCLKPTEVLVLEQRHFDRMFVKRNPRTVDELKDCLFEKLKVRSEYLAASGTNVPLFPALLDYMVNPSNERNVTIQEQLLADRALERKLQNMAASKSSFGLPKQKSSNVVSRLFPSKKSDISDVSDDDSEHSCVSSCSDGLEYEFQDTEVSEESLNHLEDRLRDFMHKMDEENKPKQNSMTEAVRKITTLDSVSKLRRLKNPKALPKSGVLVHIKGRPPGAYGEVEDLLEMDSREDVNPPVQEEKEEEIRRALGYSLNG